MVNAEEELKCCRTLVRNFADEVNALKNENKDLRNEMSLQRSQKLIFHEDAVWEMYQFLSGIARSDTFCYFIGSMDAGYVKIGFSNNPGKRLSSIQTGAPFPVYVLATMPGNRDTETILHDRFSYLLTRDNGEWFRIDDDMRLAISVCDQMAIDTEDNFLPSGHKPIKEMQRARLETLYVLSLSNLSEVFRTYDCTCRGKNSRSCPRCRIAAMQKILGRASHGESSTMKNKFIMGSE